MTTSATSLYEGHLFPVRQIPDWPRPIPIGDSTISLSRKDGEHQILVLTFPSIPFANSLWTLSAEIADHLHVEDARVADDGDKYIVIKLASYLVPSDGVDETELNLAILDIARRTLRWDGLPSKRFFICCDSYDPQMRIALAHLQCVSCSPYYAWYNLPQ